MNKLPTILLLLFAGSACAQTVPVKGEADVSALVEQVTAQKKAIELLTGQVELLKSQQRTPTEFNVLDAGVVLNDPAFDNGPILNALFARAGTMKGAINTGFYIPGGAVFFSTPIVLPVRTGLRIRGNGITLGRVEAEYSGRKQMAGPASRLVYLGPCERPAITYPGVGLCMDGITIQRGGFTDPPTRPPTDGSIGLAISANVGLPSGKAWFPQLAVIGFDRGIETLNNGDQNHADNCAFGFLIAQNNNRAFYFGCGQGMDFVMQHLFVAFNTQVVFDCGNCGHVRCEFIQLGSNALVIRTGSLGNSNSWIDLPHIKVDDYSTGWRLLEQTEKATFAVTARVYSGKKNSGGDELVKLLPDNTGYARSVDVQLLQNGKWSQIGEKP